MNVFALRDRLVIKRSLSGLTSNCTLQSAFIKKPGFILLTKNRIPITESEPSARFGNWCYSASHKYSLSGVIQIKSKDIDLWKVKQMPGWLISAAKWRS